VLAALENGPPRINQRDFGNMSIYEEAIGDAHLVAYLVDDTRRRFLMLWLRDKPIGT
jgi:hypothetical protein